MDRSSRPLHSPKALDGGQGTDDCRATQEAHDTGTDCPVPAGIEGHGKPGVGACRLSKLSDLDPVEPVQRYEHEGPGDLIHIDTKKLGRIETTGHRATGDRRDRSRGAGWEVLFIAIDDHARIAFTELYPDETQENANRFLANTHAYFCSLGVRPKAC